MKKNTKGFSLVEALAIIVLISIISFLAYPNLEKMIKKTNSNADYSLKLMAENAAKIYVANNEELVNKKITASNGKYCLPIATLSAYDFLDTSIKTADGKKINQRRCIYISKTNDYDNIKYNYELSNDLVSENTDYLPPVVMVKNIDSSLDTCSTNMYDDNITKEEFDKVCKIVVTDNSNQTFTLGNNLNLELTNFDDMQILKYVAVDESGNKSKPLEIKLKNNIN